MIDFIQKQIEASERLFEVMRKDHNTRMAEMEHWARTTQSLIEKLHERDMTINMLKNGTKEPEMGMPATDQVKALQKQVELLTDQVSRLKDENEALRLDLGLKDRGL